eukprot:COSAG02_NODE_6350_length_3630_cov_2.884452_2_plen_145_part_00
MYAAIFADHPTTSGASLLVRDDYMPAPDMHYAFVAIAGDAGPMYVGTSHDLIHWNVSDTIWQQGRKGCFDKNGCVNDCTRALLQHLTTGHVIFNQVSCRTTSRASLERKLPVALQHRQQYQLPIRILRQVRCSLRFRWIAVHMF